jgi:uncharacterized protein (TIGR03067 family)
MKSHRLLTLVVGLGLTACARGADAPKKAPGPLDGTWAVVEEAGGFGPKRLIFNGETLALEFGKGEKKKAQIKLDPTAKPKRIDFHAGKDNNPGIYQLDGETLKICFTIEGQERPAEFKAGKGVILISLKREGK